MTVLLADLCESLLEELVRIDFDRNKKCAAAEMMNHLRAVEAIRAMTYVQYNKHYVM